MSCARLSRLGVAVAAFAVIGAGTLQSCTCTGHCDPNERAVCDGDYLDYCSAPMHDLVGTHHLRDCRETDQYCVQNDEGAACVSDKRPCDPLTSKAECVDGRPSNCRSSLRGMHHPQRGSDCGAEDMICAVSPKNFAGCVHAAEPCDPKTFKQTCVDENVHLECQRNAVDETYPVKVRLLNARKCTDYAMSCTELPNSKVACTHEAKQCDPAAFTARCMGKELRLVCGGVGDGLHYEVTEYAHDCPG